MTIYTEEDFKNVQFARHSSSSMLATRDAYHYKFSRGEWQDTDGDAFTDAEMARDGWIPVHEAVADEVDLSGEMLRIAKEHQAVIKRAEKAEQERDEWMRRALDCVTAEPRPLTADDITDEMVKRAEDWYAHSSVLNDPVEDVLGILTAALTEPPPRPEGAGDIEATMFEWNQMDDNGNYALDPEILPDLADHLAESGFQYVEDYSKYCGKGPCILEDGHSGKCRC